jgi:hypothetical protein
LLTLYLESLLEIWRETGPERVDEERVDLRGTFRDGLDGRRDLAAEFNLNLEHGLARGLKIWVDIWRRCQDVVADLFHVFLPYLGCLSDEGLLSFGKLDLKELQPVFTETVQERGGPGRRTVSTCVAWSE